MKKRNFYIFITSILVVMSAFWLTIYAIVTLEINPFEDPNIIKIKGNGIKAEFQITVSEIKSDRYLQVKNKEFNFLNNFGSEYSIIYSGTSLWNIIEIEDILITNSAELTFLFKARDGYVSPSPLNLSLTENNPTLVILAYEENSVPLTYEGPIRSVLDISLFPSGKANSPYSIQQVKQIIINQA